MIASLHKRLLSAVAATALALGLAPGVLAQACPRLVDVVSEPSDEDSTSNASSHGEPSIAVKTNPQNSQELEIVVVAHSGSWDGNGGKKAPVWRSKDSGNTWQKQEVISAPTGSIGKLPLDHTVAFDAEGRLLVSLLDQSNKFGYVYAEAHAGQVDLVAGGPFGTGFADQPQLAVDRSSKCGGRTYVAWLHQLSSLCSGNPTSYVSVSIDRGKTWASAKQLGSSNCQYTTRIAAAPDGKVYAVFKERLYRLLVDVTNFLGFSKFEQVNFRVVRSDDCGENWNHLGGDEGVSLERTEVMTWFTNDFGNTAKGKVSPAQSSDAWIAVGPSDRAVYVAYVKKDDSGFGQVYVARSDDEGQNWHPYRVTDGSHQSAYPEIAVAESGVVAVLYIDYDDSGASTVFRHRLARSDDRGASWKDKVLQEMDPGPLENAVDHGLWRDYNGLVAAGNTFYGVFTGVSILNTKRQHPIFFCEPAEIPH